MTDLHRRYAVLDWTSGHTFTGGKPEGPTIILDGGGVAGPSPVVALLVAAGACSGIDVVSILEKGKVRLTRCHIEVRGRQREESPKRFLAVHLIFRLAGEGLTEANTQRAAELSVTKYCSVVQTFNPDIPITTEIVIET
jgi:putative redox protein